MIIGVLVNEAVIVVIYAVYGFFIYFSVTVIVYTIVVPVEINNCSNIVDVLFDFIYVE